LQRDRLLGDASSQRRQTGGTQEGAWFTDCACLWFQSLDGLPSNSGHAFASSPASGGMIPDKKKFWRLHWLAEVDEPGWLSPPLYWPKDSKTLAAAITALEGIMDEHLQRAVRRPKQLPFLTMWSKLADTIVEHGHSIDILRPETFHPLPKQTLKSVLTRNADVGRLSTCVGLEPTCFSTKPQSQGKGSGKGNCKSDPLITGGVYALLLKECRFSAELPLALSRVSETMPPPRKRRRWAMLSTQEADAWEWVGTEDSPPDEDVVVEVVVPVAALELPHMAGSSWLLLFPRWSQEEPARARKCQKE
jgi:hypothetical protein